VIADTGWWIALDRGQRRAMALLDETVRAGFTPITSAGVVAQVWRASPRQARLAVALRAADVVELTTAEARDIGRLLAATGGHDVVDGHIAVLAQRHASLKVLTSDRHDLEVLGVDPARIVDV
jgi:predicted nucleic acid-binding protein